MKYHKLFTRIATAGLAIFCIGCQPPERTVPAGVPLETDRLTIQRVLDDQVEAWNAGDIEQFMEGYWRSDSLRFASGGNERRGWNTTLERYLDTYPNRAAMGQLTFEDLDIRRLAPTWARVFGRYRLKRDEDLGDLTGLFTLIFEKREGIWVIVHDHTSAG